MTTGPQRPHLALRVGITGGRSILPEHEQRVSEQVADVLRLVRQEVSCLARMTEARQAYHTDANEKIMPSFRFLSPLAEGADRLAARIAHAERWDLAVPMPFHREEYALDFKTKESFDEFNMMLGWAGEDTIELDGGRDEPAQERYDEARSYEAVGRFIVRNCDLLIAVWNGKPGKGRGGTADIVQFAADSGPPVWWIHAERDTSPVWIGEGRDLNPAVSPQDATQALRDYLEQLILPPKLSPLHHQGHSWLERIAHIGQNPDEPLGVYFAETPLPRRWWAQAYRRLMKLAAGYEPDWQPSRAEDRVAAFWHNAYDVPDKRAAEYAARYRSTYVWVFGLAAIALASAAVSLGVTGRHASHALKFAATAVELAVLLLILVFVITNIRHDWHQRWIDYRLLAELYRKQQALAVLGWSLSGRAVQALVAQKEERAAWLIWLFAAMLRAAPIPHGRFTAQRCAEAREIVQRELVEEQLSYHNGRLTQCDRAGRSFVRLGEALFFIVIGVVVAKVVLLSVGRADGWTTALGLAAAILPAFAAAFIGVRAYAELELLAEQSRHMKQRLELDRDRIRQIPLSRPLASQELGVEVLEVATLMLQDVDGWARLFRVKLVEAG